MPRIYRAMTIDNGKPMIGASARALGVRVPPSQTCDIRVEADGTVRPGAGGMSVVPSWRDLPSYRIPRRLRSIVPDACGNNQDACWRMGEGPFECAPLARRLTLRPNSPAHGCVEPAAVVSLATYQADLAATQDQWVIDEQ